MGNTRRAPPSPPFTYGHNFRHADYKAGIDYDVAPRVLQYAATQTAYQPGTFYTFASTPTASNGVNQATLKSYTAGAKSRVLGGSLQINDEIFYYDYRGLFRIRLQHRAEFNPDVQCAEDGNLRRFSSTFCIALDAADQLSLSVGYLHARNIQFELPDGSANYDGLQLQYAPDWTLSAGYFHDFHWSAGYLRAKASSRYEDSFYSDFNHTPGGRQQPYVKTMHRSRIIPRRLESGAWIKNIENVAVIAATAGAVTCRRSRRVRRRFSSRPGPMV